MLQALHQRVKFLSAAGLAGELLQPFAKGGIKGLALRFGNQSSLLDQLFLGAQSDVLHTKTVYTKSVGSSSATIRDGVGFIPPHPRASARLTGVSRRNACIIPLTLVWRNWQTRRTQNPVAARPCGFDSLHQHHLLRIFTSNWFSVGALLAAPFGAPHAVPANPHFRPDVRSYETAPRRCAICCRYSMHVSTITMRSKIVSTAIASEWVRAKRYIW